MSGIDSGPNVQKPREAGDHGPEGRAPVFGSWAAWYLLVALDLAIVIAICAWITRAHR